MTELSGILEGVGLPAIARFLYGLKKTGCLHLVEHEWHGEVFFEEGKITTARLGSRTGMSAVEAILETLPAARFSLDSQSPTPADSKIELSQDEILKRLDEVAARVAYSKPRLLAPEVIPALVTGDGNGEEPLPLDRGTLQTLVAVDGHRSVREIVAVRETVDALWQLAHLADLGLIQVKPASISQSPADIAEPLAPSAEPPASGSDSSLDTSHCPRLGFEDDPSNSFGRPTRLHRCFAANTPVALSLDQQRDLCLTDKYPACPRLNAAMRQAGENRRIVRLAPVARQPGTQSDRDAAAPDGVSSDPRPFRASAATARDTTASPSSSGSSSTPTPLRARILRPSVNPAASVSAASDAEPSPSPVPPRRPMISRPTAAAAAAARSMAEAPSEARRQRPQPLEPRRIMAEPTSQGTEPAGASGSPLRLLRGWMTVIASAGIVLAVLAVAGYLLLPQLDSLFSSDSIDPATLPNASLVAAGTPVTDLPGRPTAQPTTPSADDTVASPDSDTSASHSPAAAPVAPAQPVATSAVAQSQATLAGPSAVTPNTAAQTPGSDSSPAIFDERFLSNDARWPSDPQGTALFSNGIYRVGTRQAGQFAALGAPIASVPSDVVISATVRKLAGPPGGGYGIIVRDQSPNALDGNIQSGRYYVLEAGDKGEVGIWRRDGTQWVDLLSWQRSDAVKPGTDPNELTVRAVGSNLSLSVNGTQVASLTDATLSSGGAGLFVGGDGNDVAVSHFAIQAP